MHPFMGQTSVVRLLEAMLITFLRASPTFHGSALYLKCHAVLGRVFKLLDAIIWTTYFISYKKTFSKRLREFKSKIMGYTKPYYN